MYMLFISFCAWSTPMQCNYVNTSQKFLSFGECVEVGSRALYNPESAARIVDYRCVKITK